MPRLPGTVLAPGNSDEKLTDQSVHRRVALSRIASDCSESLFINAQSNVLHEHSLCVTVCFVKVGWFAGLLEYTHLTNSKLLRVYEKSHPKAA